MHIEPGLVSESKLWLSYVTAAGAGTYAIKLSLEAIRERGPLSLVMRTGLAAALVFGFFEVLPHYPVGVSEVHLILGTTLFLLLGAAPASLGLALGLLVQGLFFAPFDLPQFSMNVTTLLVPLFAIQAIAARVIGPETAYVDLTYRQALALSTTYQAGIVAWVAFWALYGNGVTVTNIASIASFGGAYLLVIVVEPLADLAVLAIAKVLHTAKDSRLLARRLYHPA